MNYHKMIRADIANGVGFRVTLFVSGCTNHCKGCQNPQTWPFDSGKPFTEETMKKLLNEVKDVHCAGLSLSGGDPLNPLNAPTVAKICQRVKEECPNKDIWCWTRLQVRAYIR